MKPEACAPTSIAAVDGREQALQPALLRVEAGRARGRARFGAVGERKHHSDQRRAVADGVMNADDRRRAALVFLDDVDLPERSMRIERLAGQIRDELLQRLFAAPPRQARAMDMAREVELRVVAPIGDAGADLDALAETSMRRQSLAELRLQPLQRDRPLEHQDADDHHQIVRPIHPQPRQIDRRHAFAATHDRLPPETGRALILTSCLRAKMPPLRPLGGAT